MSTRHDKFSSPTTKELDIHYSKIIATAHSHPKGWKTIEEEKYSMGYKNNGKEASGDWFWHRVRVKGKFDGKKIDVKPYPNYVYFPASCNLWDVQYNGPAFIRKINDDYKRFNFGVLNHK